MENNLTKISPKAYEIINKILLDHNDYNETCKIIEFNRPYISRYFSFVSPQTLERANKLSENSSESINNSIEKLEDMTILLKDLQHFNRISSRINEYQKLFENPHLLLRNIITLISLQAQKHYNKIHNSPMSSIQRKYLDRKNSLLEDANIAIEEFNQYINLLFQYTDLPCNTQKQQYIQQLKEKNQYIQTLNQALQQLEEHNQEQPQKHIEQLKANNHEQQQYIEQLEKQNQEQQQHIEQLKKQNQEQQQHIQQLEKDSTTSDINKDLTAPEEQNKQQ